ncbi:MAG: proline--tRNA ligase [Oligoflexales bacterium]
MAKNARNAISPSRAENYPEWYQQVIKAADLAENAPVRGCMVIKPWGFGIWELMQRALDDMIKATGHVNACFPLLIPLSFLEKEATHVEGFAKECAVVTHHRLEGDGQGGLKPAGELEEPYVIRPTSETIIGHSYSKWVQSYRDLPILINQWANVMRWEMRTRIFLRTSEFFWQEGHTVHATAEEAQEETLKMLDVYEDFAENWLAVPVFKGLKTPDERFPGAEETYSIEALMQDGKALQAGTSHFLGQNFAKASDISFLDQEGNSQFAWTTSWGVSTRLMGALIMTHSDDDGLVLPPRIAPFHIVILPIYKNAEDRARVLEFCHSLNRDLIAQRFNHVPLRVSIDDRDIRGGEKSWQNIKKGVPIRLEVGPRDVDKNSVFMGRRDRAPKDKVSMTVKQLISEVCSILETMQNELLLKAKEFRTKNTKVIDNIEEFEDFFSASDASLQAGFALCHWNEAAIGHSLLTKYKVSPRCIPFDSPEFPPEAGRCLFTGKESRKRIVFAKSY